ncbi:hypothetical protein D3C84_1273860 [compost metagenome]
MDGAHLEALQLGSKMFNPNGSGYGIRNVQERIKLYYGEAFGLQFFSSPGDGMIVEVHIPLIMDSDSL